ncbi:MAG: GMC family oxidoreductase [Gammaproteobacteria bacterium]
MLDDLAHHPDAATLRGDVAVVGAGAAGLTLARALVDRGLDVIVLESGGLDFEAAVQALAAGPNLGEDYYPLIDSRLRFFGGTTAIWGGRCATFEPIDFAPRPWLPLSGWPLDADTLAPYLARAAADFELGVDGGRATSWDDDSAARFAFDPDAFVSRCWRFDDSAERFQAVRMQALLEHPRLRVLLHATVTHVRAAPDASRVERLDVATLGGRRATVAARAYVLAAGGIDNARLLLAADDVEAAGIGNGYDQVGRYFMEHPHGRAGMLDAGQGFALWAAFQRQVTPGGERRAPVLLPSPTLQREAGILNSAFTFKLQAPHPELSLRKRLYRELQHDLAPTRNNRRLWQGYRRLRKAFQRSLRRPIEQARLRRGLTRVHVIVRGEQAPNPASRVLRTTERDALGMPRVGLDWRLSAIDKRTVAVMAERLGAEFERLGIGRLTPAAWLHETGTAWPVDPTVSNHPVAGYHHMGTTRMSADPRHGVVDGDCRVHGYANLYVAGSSVFATSSWANPTLLIVALAHRLGAHLGKVLR